MKRDRQAKPGAPHDLPRPSRPPAVHPHRLQCFQHLFCVAIHLFSVYDAARCPRRYGGPVVATTTHA